MAAIWRFGDTIPAITEGKNMTRRRVVLGASAALVLTSLVAAFTMKPGYPLTVLGDILQSLGCLAFLAGMAINIPRARGRMRTFWELMALGALLLTMLQAFWVYFEIFLKTEVPDPFIGDILALLHVVPMIGALALSPHARSDGPTFRTRSLDFLILVLWWVYLYIFLVVPWQFVAPNQRQYGNWFNLFDIAEGLVYIPLLVYLVISVSGRWRVIYANLCGAYLLHLVFAALTNYAVDANYHTGSWYDVGLVASAVWLGWVGYDAWENPPESLPAAAEPKKPALGLARIAMLAVLSIPVIGLWERLDTTVPARVQDFRLAVSLGAMLLLAALIFLRQNLLDHELLTALDEAKESYASLQRLQGQLIQSEKMASLGQLVAGAAHEINNPLTAILGYLDMLRERPQLSEQDRSTVVKIEQHARRTKTLVSHLLSFSKQIPGDKRRIAINSLLQNAVKMREVELANRRIQIAWELAGSLPIIVGDSSQLLQVFFHIINNAADAMQPVPEPLLLIRTRVQGEAVVIEFADNGPGIQSPERIFDPFFTTKPVGKGSGLGLSAAYGIIQEHQGEIECENRPGGGAIFRITLPFQAQPATAAALA
jgi:signal transduction histidine kinase